MPQEAELLYSLKGKKIWVTGHGGMVGKALLRRLANEDCEVLTATRGEVDLRRQADVEAWMEKNRPHAVILAAATVGGILANDSRPAEFIYDNLAIEANVIQAAWKTDVEKLLFLGSACIYPKMAPQPMAEDSLLTGPLEETNQWYAIAKIAGIKLCQAYRKQYGCDFISAQPINLYGPADNFDLASSHVVPALLRKAHEAKKNGEPTLPVWGSGKAMREFLYVDDLADALVFLLQRYSDPLQVNIGTGEELSIRELAETIVRAVGLKAELDFDTGKPDGAPRKLLDSTLIAEMGWTAKTPLAEGLARTYEWFLEHHKSG
ncbi:MAG: GDP-L-fucose synthase [Rhodospirillales bacterium]|nr:GDP-L-fucose synthase [Rhodospirillales bacterium]